MSGDKTWKKPELVSFKNAEEAVAYYSKNGTPQHVEAVRRLHTEMLQERQAMANRMPRVTKRR